MHFLKENKQEADVRALSYGWRRPPLGKGNTLMSRKKLHKIKRFLPLYLMTLPALAYLFINNYMPMPGLILAFKKFNAQMGIYGSPWAGLKNFEFLVESRDFPIILRNTILYNLAFIVLDLIFGVLLAIFITEIRNLRARKVAQSLVLFPFVVSIIIVSYMVRSFLDPEAGLINHLLMDMGMDSIQFYSKEQYWPFILIFVHLWKSIGYGCIIYISSILGIDQSLMESASLDGASKIQKIRYITLPFLKPTMITLTLLAVGRICTTDFGLFYQVPQDSGLIMDVTNTIDTFVYRALLTQNNVGMSAAAGFFQSVVGFSFILIFNGITRKVSKENALF